LKYLKYTTFGWDNTRTRKSEFVAKTQFLYINDKFCTVVSEITSYVGYPVVYLC